MALLTTRLWIRCLLVFALTLSVSLVLIVTTKGPLGAADDGAFYITLGKLTWEHGFIKDLPWLYFTDYHTQSPGLHWLYPILIAPLAGALPGAYATILIGTIGFSSAIAMFYYVTSKLPVRWPGFWTLVLVFSSGDFAYRLLFARPIAVSVIVLLLGWYFTLRKRSLALLLLSLVYVWLYDAYILLPMVVGVTAFTELRGIRAKLVTFLASVVGSICGLILNPYFPKNTQKLHFLVTPSWGTSLQTSNEWQPLSISTFAEYSPLIIACLGIAALCAVIHFDKEKKILRWPATTGSLLVLDVMWIVLTLQSRRFIEYAAVFITLTTAALITALLKDKKVKWITSWHTTVGALVFIALFCWGAWKSGHWSIVSYRNNMYPTAVYQPAATWLSTRLPTDTLIVNTSWDQFPQLFFWSPTHYYVTGLDPVFLYQHSPDLYWRWRRLADGTTLDGQEAMSITKQLGSNVIFLEPIKNPKLYTQLLQSPEVATRQYCDPGACIFIAKY